MNFRDTIGHAEETAATGAVGTATSLMAYQKEIVTDVENLNTGLVVSGAVNLQFPNVDQQASVIEIDLADINDDYCSNVEITAAGTIDIYRFRTGTDAAWQTIINAAALTESGLGSVGYSYDWPNASWAQGDLFRIHIGGVQVTLGTKVFEIPRKTFHGVVGTGTAGQNITDIDTDLGEPADAASIPGAGSVNAKLTGIGTALGVVAAGAGTGFEIDGNPSLYSEEMKIPKSDGAVTWNATALASIQTEANDALVAQNLDHVAAVTDGAGNFPNTAVDGSIISKMISKVGGGDTSSYDETTDSLEMLSDKLGAFTGDGGAAQDDSVKASLDVAHTDIDAILADTGTDGVVVNDRTATYSRQAGITQVLEVSVTSAANAAPLTLATVTTQPCLIKTLVVHADTAAQADLTSVAVTGGAANVITFLTAAQGAKANIDAVDEQVAWTGAVRLAATKTIVMTFVGTGATPVDLTVTIEYEACVDGGFLA